MNHEGHEVSRRHGSHAFLRDTSCPSWLKAFAFPSALKSRFVVLLKCPELGRMVQALQIQCVRWRTESPGNTCYCTLFWSGHERRREQRTHVSTRAVRFQRWDQVAGTKEVGNGE
jgi:hypothetical protein